MLGPMPIACNLGLTPLAAQTIVPMALGLGGNAVTVSTRFWQAMEAQGAGTDLDPATAGAALRAVVAGRVQNGSRPAALCRGPSAFGAQLRAALLARGLRHRPGPRHRDRHPAAAADGRRAWLRAASMAICVGEPWNTAAVTKGVGRIATVKAAIWR